MNEDDAVVCYQQGTDALARDDYGAALEHFVQVLDMRPDLADAWVGKARALAGLQLRPEALAAAERALLWSPAHAGALATSGAVLVSSDQYANAVQMLERALALDDTLADAWLALAAAHTGLGHSEAALAACDRALELRPDDASAQAARQRIARRMRLAGAAGGMPDLFELAMALLDLLH